MTQDKPDETAHGENGESGAASHAKTSAPGDGGVVVQVSAPATGNDDQQREDAEFDAIDDRLDAIDKRITELATDGRKWTEKTIASLQQEVADLKVTLKAVGENLPAQVTELKAELTRLSQELQLVSKPPEPETTSLAAVVLTPPLVPPDPNKPSGEVQEGHAGQVQEPPKRTKRVI